MGHAADANLTILSTQMVGFLSFPVQYWPPLKSEKAEKTKEKTTESTKLRAQKVSKKRTKVEGRILKVILKQTTSEF